MIKTVQTSRGGFTLVEILIVVVILGILASIVIPQFSNATYQSKAVATASIVRTVQAKVFEKFAVQGEYPETIADSWFVEGQLPINPMATSQNDPVVFYDDSATADMTHPAAKVVSTTGAFWYNESNGTFRALVPAQDTQADTLKLYNEANSSKLTNYSDTTN